MYLIRAEGYTSPFNNTWYKEQRLANEDARVFSNTYKSTFYVCKIVDIAVYNPPFENIGGKQDERSSV